MVTVEELMTATTETMGDLPPHMHEPMAQYVVRGIRPGDFLTGLFENNLMKAVGHADHINQHSIKEFTQWVYTFAPSPCHGSPEIVAAWIASGGLHGQAVTAKTATL